MNASKNKKLLMPWFHPRYWVQNKISQSKITAFCLVGLFNVKSRVSILANTKAQTACKLIYQEKDKS